MVNLQDIIALINSKKKSSFPWKRQEPYLQPYFAYSPSSQSWQEIETSNSPPPSSSRPVANFSILSWNIDFMLPFTNERMLVGLNHLHSLTSNSNTPSIVLLNECLVSDLQLIQSQPWIQESYHITDVDDRFWESGHYGTCTLIPKSLSINSVFRVHYDATRMERDVLCVDLDVEVDGGNSGGNQNRRVLRVCNTHLESLVADPPLRPAQLTTAAQYMHAQDVFAAVVGGDFNAIQPFDRTLHSENGLKDAYLEMGGKEDSEEGYTWGQMAPVKQREMFGCSRMDKLWFCGGVKVEGFERFGLGLKVENSEVERVLREEEGMDEGWVTDHAGVWGKFRIVLEESGASNSKI